MTTMIINIDRKMSESARADIIWHKVKFWIYCQRVDVSGLVNAVTVPHNFLCLSVCFS